MSVQGQALRLSNRLEVKNGELYLHDAPVTPRYSRRGIQIGCYFVTYEALDRIHKDSQQ